MLPYDACPKPTHRPILVTDTCKQKLNDAYAHVTAEDDELAVPAYTIAESSIFVDCDPLPEDNQTRSRFNVVAHGSGTYELLRRKQQIYGGKIRLSVTHCHQFGNLARLSETDVAGFRRILSNPCASKPYADGSRIPVILVVGAGDHRRLVGFYVTPEEVHPARLMTIRDTSPMIASAINRAPVAMPGLPRIDLVDRILQQLGPDWTVRVARSKRTGKTALLLQHTTGRRGVIEVSADFPNGRPRMIACNNPAINGGIAAHTFDFSNAIQSMLQRDLAHGGFTLHVVPDDLPQFATPHGIPMDDQIVFLDFVDWAKLAELLLHDTHDSCQLT